MRAFAYLVATLVYVAALSYLILGTLGFSFGLRINGNIYADLGLGLQRTTYLVLLGVVVCSGLYSAWRFNRRSVKTRR